MSVLRIAKVFESLKFTFLRKFIFYQTSLYFIKEYLGGRNSKWLSSEKPPRLEPQKSIRKTKAIFLLDRLRETSRGVHTAELHRAMRRNNAHTSQPPLHPYSQLTAGKPHPARKNKKEDTENGKANFLVQSIYVALHAKILHCTP